MTTRAVILDVDGTLVDSNDAHAQAWVDAFAAEGIAVTYDAVRRAIGMGGDKLMPAVAGIAEDSPLGQRTAERRAREFKERQLPRIKPCPSVRALAERLAADGYVLAVASSAKEEELEPLLEIAGVTDLIAKRASSDDAGASKPDPDIVEAALRGTGATPAGAIMLGDTPYERRGRDPCRHPDRGLGMRRVVGRRPARCRCRLCQSGRPPRQVRQLSVLRQCAIAETLPRARPESL